MLTLHTALLVLVVLTSVIVPIAVYVLTRKRHREDIEQLMHRVERSLDAAVKLLEVRDYYLQTSESLKNMLQEAYREGNRSRQDQIRKLIDRLDTLKVRALDRTVGVLQGEGGPSAPRRRRRGRRPRRRRRPGPPPSTQAANQ